MLGRDRQSLGAISRAYAVSVWVLAIFLSAQVDFFCSDRGIEM